MGDAAAAQPVPKPVEDVMPDRPVGMCFHWNHGYADGYQTGFRLGVQAVLEGVREPYDYHRSDQPVEASYGPGLLDNEGVGG